MFLIYFFIALCFSYLWYQIEFKRSCEWIYFPYIDLCRTEKKIDFYFLIIRFLRSITLLFFLLYLFATISFYLKKSETSSQDDLKKVSPIFWILDVSNSMSQQFVVEEELSRLDALKKVLKKEGESISSNCFQGVFSFSRYFNLDLIPTNSHSEFFNIIENLQVRNDQGSSIGSCLSYALSFLEHNMQGVLFNDPILILCTDGQQQIHPQDRGNPLKDIGFEEIKKKACSLKIPIYVVHFLPYSSQETNPDLYSLKELSFDTGGHYFLIESLDSLENAFKKLYQNFHDSLSEKIDFQTILEHLKIGFTLSLIGLFVIDKIGSIVLKKVSSL